jgi:hypothetical protein
VRPLVALAPSPLLGPAVWEPVADELAAGGTEAGVLAPPPAPRTPADVLSAFEAQLPRGRDVVLVPHSNAGLYVPELVARRRIVAVAFVDAALPPLAGSVALAPASMASFLDARTDAAGLLPPWSSWWEEDIGPLFPDPGVRARVERQQARLPRTYFDATLPVPAGWDDVPCCYVAFGDTYARERAEAAARGYRVTTMPGDHLHMLWDPAGVAGEVVTLVASLGAPPPLLF